MTTNSKTKTVICTLIIGIVLYTLLLFVCPNLHILTWDKNNRNSDEVTINLPLNENMTIEQWFIMPFDRVTRITPSISSNNSEDVIMIDATLELIKDNVTVYTKHISSAYDCVLELDNVNVEAGSVYGLKLTVSKTESDIDSIIPTIEVTEDGSAFIYTLSGNYGGAPDKAVFGVFYFSVLILLLWYIWSFYSTDKKTKINNALIIWIVMVLISVLLVSQYYDLYIIAKGAFRMLDAFKAGNITDYMNYAYDSELLHQSSKLSFAYEYDFFTILVILIVLLPFAPFTSGEMLNNGINELIIIYLSIVITILLILIASYSEKIWKKYIGNEYAASVKYFFLFSPLLLYISVWIGQIDVFYTFLIVIALFFYYKGNILAFSLIMSFPIAMKTIPLMIFIPLLLLTQKNIKKIIAYTAISLSASVFSTLMFERNTGNQAITNIIEEDYHYIDRLAQIRISENLSLFILAFALICIFAFSKKIHVENKKELIFWSMFLIFILYSSFAVMVNWHSQWFIPLILSLSFLIPLCKEKHLLLQLDIVMEALFLIAANLNGSSIFHINYGCLPNFTQYDYSGVSVIDILNNISSIAITTVFTCLAAVLTCMAVIIYRTNSLSSGLTEIKQDPTDINSSYTIIFSRIWILMATAIFYLWCYWYVG